MRCARPASFRRKNFRCRPLPSENLKLFGPIPESGANLKRVVAVARLLFAFCQRKVAAPATCTCTSLVRLLPALCLSQLFILTIVPRLYYIRYTPPWRIYRLRHLKRASISNTTRSPSRKRTSSHRPQDRRADRPMPTARRSPKASRPSRPGGSESSSSHRSPSRQEAAAPAKQADNYETSPGMASIDEQLAMFGSSMTSCRVQSTLPAVPDH